MSSQQGQQGWEKLNAFLNGGAFGKARTNREAFQDGPTAFRAWVALQPGVPFDKWLDQPAKLIFPGGKR